MSKFVILECNRDRAIDVNSQTELTDPYKNKWTNQVSNSGIIVNSGDVLTIEQSIVNVKGASTEVMEFRGTNNKNGITDNKIGLQVAYYVNHTGKNTGNMPMVEHQIFRGTGDLQKLATNATAGGNTADGGNVYVAGDQHLSYTENRFQNMIGDRCIGETFFLNFPFNDDNFPPANPDDPFDPYDNTLGFQNLNIMPQVNKVFRLKTIQRGGGIAGNVNSGFIAGQDYGISTNDGGAGTAQGQDVTDMTFRILTTTSEGAIPNVVETFELINFGNKEFSGDPIRAPFTAIQITLAVGANNGTDHIWEVVGNVLNPNYKSSDIRRFDGEKYFPLAHDFTGLAVFEDSQVVRSDGIPPPTIDVNLDLNLIKSIPLLRTKNVELEIPQGFQTPSNVANILTEQIGRPQKISIENNVGDFVDASKIVYAHTNPNGNYEGSDNPNIIGSQVFQPASCNFMNFGQGIPNNGSFCGRRTTFYQSIAWKEPERWTALVPAFKQFSVGNSPFSVNNDIAINYGTRAVGFNDFGDFTRQGIGEFGSHAVIISDPVNIGANEVDMTRGKIICSNIRFTRKNLIKLQKMKDAEKYMGDLSLKVDTESANYKEYLSVNLDVGIYDDELSTQGQLTGNGLVSDGENTDQRHKFATIDEAITDGFCVVVVDRGHSRALNGFQRDLKVLPNDGQMLSNVWIKTRYNSGFQYNIAGGNLNNSTIQFSNTFNDWNGQTHFNTAGTDINQVFGQGYFDANDDRFYSIEDLNNLAKEFDLAVVPVNVPINPAIDNQNFNWFQNDYALNQQPPFIGFISAQHSGASDEAVFDPVKQFSNTDNIPNWIIDSSNFKFGMILGFDPSFTRNKAVCFQNNQFSDFGQIDPRNFLNMINIGAIDPKFSFDPAFSRFSISGLNTPEYQGNGLTTDDSLEFTPSDDPQEQVITFNRRHQILPSRQKDEGSLAPNTPITQAYPELLRIGQFGGARQKSGTFIDSQSGVSITGINLFNDSNTIVDTLDPSNYFNNNDYLFHGSLFDKMGFSIETILPKFGGANAFFRDPTLYRATDTYRSALNNRMKPLSTGADVKTTITQATSLNFASAPLFDLGGDTLQNTIRPDAVQGEITASKLPNKFDFSYLTINSSLVQEGTDTKYIGGADNQSLLPCMTYLTRENNESDFFYQNERSFTFTATKDFTITDISTDIRLPDGSRPNLDPHSTIIYKIEKPLNSLNPQSNRVSQSVRTHDAKQNEQRNLQK
tara:strand:+ start:1741 stop:5445 length:3705 start_codon:yes stop_codon:yes gene_type:complete